MGLGFATVLPALLERAPASETTEELALRVARTAKKSVKAVLHQGRHDFDAQVLGVATFVLGLGGAVVGWRRRALVRQLTVSTVPQISLDALEPSAAREAILGLAAALRSAVDAEKPDIVLIFDTLLRGAIHLGASDLHFQPLDTGTRVSFRVGGVLEDVMTVPPAVHKPLVMRVKVLARLITYVSDKPQDGHLTVPSDAGPTDVRVSLLPTSHGEKVVLRIARAGVQIPGLEALGLTPALQHRFLPILKKPQGLIYFAGPTGSGKTTTIYAALGHIKKERGETIHIATIEDPVEFDVPFLTQTSVRPDAGLTFAQGLRSMLRQDPNVMMVGEIRDAETAGIAIQAGLSGHLILTTIHAESAAGVFARLIEMGVEPFVLASASLASVSQRLVRVLCPHCRRVGPPTQAQQDRLGALGAKANFSFEPVGCVRCGNRGYLGRTAIYELLEVTPSVRELINQRVPTPEIVKAAQGSSMETMLSDGVAKADVGVTSLDEVFRVVG